MISSLRLEGGRRLCLRSGKLSEAGAGDESAKAARVAITA